MIWLTSPFSSEINSGFKALQAFSSSPLARRWRRYRPKHCFQDRRQKKVQKSSIESLRLSSHLVKRKEKHKRNFPLEWSYERKVHEKDWEQKKMSFCLDFFLPCKISFISRSELSLLFFTMEKFSRIIFLFTMDSHENERRKEISVRALTRRLRHRSQRLNKLSETRKGVDKNVNGDAASWFRGTMKEILGLIYNCFCHNQMIVSVRSHELSSF